MLIRGMLDRWDRKRVHALLDAAADTNQILPVNLGEARLEIGSVL